MPRKAHPPETRQSARARSEYRECLAVLKAARAAAGVSQAELARRLGKPQSWVDKCESGQRRVDFVELIRIAQALGMKPQGILSECADRLSPVKAESGGRRRRVPAKE